MKEYADLLPPHTEIKVMGSDQESRDRLIGKLGAIGINFMQKGVLNAPISADGTVGIEITVKIDPTLFRAIAKIAFNYVAYQRGTDFALQPVFDDVRNYIRYGAVPSWEPVVLPSNTPILFNDSHRSPQTSGHLITFDRNLAGTGLVSQVSLFNTITYRVGISPKYPGPWNDSMRTGHHFNYETKTVTLLRSSPPPKSGGDKAE